MVMLLLLHHMAHSEGHVFMFFLHPYLFIQIKLEKLKLMLEQMYDKIFIFFQLIKPWLFPKSLL